MKRNEFRSHLEWSKTCEVSGIFFYDPQEINQTVNETNAAPLTLENCSNSYRASSEDAKSDSTSGATLQIIEATASTKTLDGQEAYERGTALKNVGLFRQAAEHFEKAAQDPAYALKGFAHMGLCLKRSGKQEEAIVAFRRSLRVPATFLKEQVQILYLLGRTLESLGRIPEALESYRWLRREAPQYRDVTKRIESLSTRRTYTDNRKGQDSRPWAQQALQIWQSLLRNGKERPTDNLFQLWSAKEMLWHLSPTFFIEHV